MCRLPSCCSWWRSSLGSRCIKVSRTTSVSRRAKSPWRSRSGTKFGSGRTWSMSSFCAWSFSPSGSWSGRFCCRRPSSSPRIPPIRRTRRKRPGTFSAFRKCSSISTRGSRASSFLRSLSWGSWRYLLSTPTRKGTATSLSKSVARRSPFFSTAFSSSGYSS